MNKKYIPIILGVLTLIPFIYYLLNNGSCGWDCGWYIWRLGTTPITEFHNLTEPLYFWLFKPFVILGLNPIIVMKASMILMLSAAMFGIYRLSRLMGMSIIQSSVVMMVFALHISTIRLWSDTLRNFLAYTIMPYIIYYYIRGKKYDTLKSYLMILLMALSHRMVLAIFPILFIYNIIKKDYKKMAIELLIIAIPIVLIYLLIKGESGSYAGGLFSPLLYIIDIEGLKLSIMHNIGLIGYFGGGTLLLGLLGMQMTKQTDPMKMISLIFVVFITSTVFLNFLVFGRLVLMLSLPISILTGMWLIEVSKKSKKVGIFLYITSGLIILLTLILGVHTVATAEGQISYDEIELINSLDLPENSTLIVPDRIGWYSIYVWNDTLDVHSINDYGIHYGRDYLDENKTLFYQTLKDIQKPFYYIDGQHFKPNISNPLKVIREVI